MTCAPLIIVPPHCLVQLLYRFVDVVRAASWVWAATDRSAGRSARPTASCTGCCHALSPALKPWPPFIHPRRCFPAMLASTPTAGGSARPGPGDVLLLPGSQAPAAAQSPRALSVRPLSPLGRRWPLERLRPAEVPRSASCAS